MKPLGFQRAKWIFVKSPLGEVRDKYFDYKIPFVAREGKAELLISAHSNYCATVNGIFADCGQMPDYETRQIYDTLDITELVQPGENVLELTQYVAGRSFSTARPAVPAVIFEIRQEGTVLAYSGEHTLSGENRRYLSLKEEISGQCGYNCAYDANLPDTVFEESVLADKPSNLIPRPVQKVRIGAPMAAELLTQGLFVDREPNQVKSQRMQTAFLSTMLRQELLQGKQQACRWGGETLPCTDLAWQLPEGCSADGAYFVFDLGNEYAGFVDVELETQEPVEVLIGYGEHLQDLRVRAKVHNRHFCFGYKAKPGKNRFFHSLQRIAGRYLQVHIYGKAGVINRVGIRSADYPVTRQPMPVTDGLDQWIWEVGCRTLELCMHEHYEDCPWREQALYTMDSRVQMLCGYYAYKEYAFAREALRTALESLRPDGLLELCPPGIVSLNIPSYTAVYVRQVLEYMQYSDDLTLGQECFEGLTRIVEGLRQRIDETGLFAGHQGHEYWHFYEWRPGMHTLGITEPGFYEAPMQAFVADAFSCYDQICTVLKKPGGAVYAQAAKDLLCKAHQVFFDPQAGAYKTHPKDEAPVHELTQAMMLFVGGVPEEEQARVRQSILDGKLIPTSLSMTIYTYEALLQDAENKAFVLEKIRQVWGEMLRAGAQTFWETEDGHWDFDRAGSLCHGWSAVPIYIFARYGLEN